MGDAPNRDYSKMERAIIYHTREERKMKQIATCPECGGVGEDYEIYKNDDGEFVEENNGVCARCDGDSYGCCCAICGDFMKSDSEFLDFHHWDYDEHIGVLLCRECHDEIHKNKSAYPSLNDEWREEAIATAFRLLRKKNPEQVPGRRTSDKTWKEDAKDALNVPEDLPVPDIDDI